MDEDAAVPLSAETEKKRQRSSKTKAEFGDDCKVFFSRVHVAKMRNNASLKSHLLSSKISILYGNL